MVLAVSDQGDLFIIGLYAPHSVLQAVGDHTMFGNMMCFACEWTADTLAPKRRTSSLGQQLKCTFGDMLIL